MKTSLSCMKMNLMGKHNFILIVSHEDSFWHRGKRQLPKWPIHNSAPNNICHRFSLLIFPVVSNEDPSEPVNHDYNVLEGPEETGDERAKDSISRDPDRTSEESDLSLEASKILNMEDNPAYAKPWKAKEDPELPHEPSDFLNIENNPAYSSPWRTKTAEPCLRGRAYSL